MENTYFLIFIGVLAAVLLLVAVRFEKRHRQNMRKLNQKARHKAQLQHRRAVVPHHGLDDRNTSIQPRNRTAWEKRHKRAGEELRHGTSITANRLFSDDEIAEEENESGLEMKTIQFTPENLSTSRASRR